MLYSLPALAQNRTYVIEGKLKQPVSGKVYLYSDVIERKYYGNNPIIDSASLHEGVFMIRRIIHDSSPLAYRLSVKTNSFQKTTGMIILEQKDQNIFIDTIDEYISPYILQSPSQSEIKNEYEPFFKSFIERVTLFAKYSDSLALIEQLLTEVELHNLTQIQNNIILEGDSLFYNYSKKHSGSFTTLWKLIERFSNFGYKKMYLDIFNFLDYKIKKSAIAKLLLNDLNYSKQLSVGNIFPTLKLKDINNKPVLVKCKSKYTLIDFWFSQCLPCLRQFPSYKKLYLEYKKNGFDIIGISVDSKKNIVKWKNTIQQKQLDWQQFLDQDGILSKDLLINSFPTNFLLDDRGKIIKKNITLPELKELLILSSDIFFDDPIHKIK